MNANGWLIAYSVSILLFSLLGGYVPFLGKVSHSRLQFYLSLSAGVMLGASFFHVMPEAMAYAGPWFGWWMSLAVVGLFCIERFIAPHSHEVDGEGHDHHHDHDEEHAHEHGAACEHEEKKLLDHPEAEHQAAAPAVAGWMAVLGLTIHTFMNGVGLAGAVSADCGKQPTEAHSTIVGLALPGLAMFLAIICHKPFDALAISTVLTRKGVKRRKLLLVQFGFASMIPIGVLAFIFAQKGIEASLRSQLTGAALAFSAGTFLFIALSDLLPEVQFHRHDRFGLFLALVFGVLIMGGIALLEDHDEHGGAKTEQSNSSQAPTGS